MANYKIVSVEETSEADVYAVRVLMTDNGLSVSQLYRCAKADIADVTAARAWLTARANEQKAVSRRDVIGTEVAV